MSIPLLFLFSFIAGAYVPELSTMTLRAADQHGRGVYQIEQEVTFQGPGEPQVVRETWLTNGESESRLTLEGRGSLHASVSGTALYSGSTRIFIESGSSTRSQGLGDNWFEPLFFFHSPRWFRARLAALRIAPADAFKDRAPLPSEGDLHYEPSTLVRLSRTGGVVAWEIGVPPSGPDSSMPALWLEQDQFTVRKVRAGEAGAAVKGEDFTKYADGLWLPRTRTYTVGANTVTAQILSVRSLGKAAPLAARFKPSSLSARDAYHPPDAEGLRDFYNRFR